MNLVIGVTAELKYMCFLNLVRFLHCSQKEVYELARSFVVLRCELKEKMTQKLAGMEESVIDLKRQHAEGLDKIVGLEKLVVRLRVSLKQFKMTLIRPQKRKHCDFYGGSKKFKRIRLKSPKPFMSVMNFCTTVID